MVNCKNGSTLGDAVAVKNLNTKAVEEVCHILIKRSTTRDNHIDFTAKGSENIFLKEFIKRLKSDFVTGSVEAHKTLNKTACKLTLLLNSLENSSVEGLNVKRNCNKVTGLMLLKLLQYILNARGDVNIASDTVLSVNRNAGAVGVMRGKHVHTSR